MTDPSGLLRLMAWMSPVFPTGSFAYSSGLEAAVQCESVSNQADLREWLTGQLENGANRNDAIFLAEAWRLSNDEAALADLTELALAMVGSSERYLETTAQADAFADAVKNWSSAEGAFSPSPCVLPISIGIVAGRSGLDLQQTLFAYLQSVVTNQTQVSIRLGIIGQTAAATILAQMESIIVRTAQQAEKRALDDLGSASVLAEIAAMQHEELPGRMFRS